MDYYSKIKPVLNKLSELEVFDSLDVIRRYVKCSQEGRERALIPGIHNPVANSVEIWFADFMIVNILKYCQTGKSNKTLRDVNTRYRICNPIHDLSTAVDHDFINDDPWLWVTSYIFNQAKMRAESNLLILLYRYYCLYKTPCIRAYAEKILGVSLDVYFGMAFYVYSIMGIDDRFGVCEDYFMPLDADNNQEEIKALNSILKEITRSLPEMKQLCREYCKYDEFHLFRVYDNAPHIEYPLIKEGKLYYCVRPDYILSPLLDGLYFKLDIPNCEDNDAKHEFATNLEGYVGMIFDHFFSNGKIEYRREITYDDGKEKCQKTSDWILWDEDDICFLDCKTKRISIKAKQEAILDENFINMVVDKQPFTRKEKREIIDKGLPEGLTKDLINLGIDLGRIYVSYDTYKAGKVNVLPYMEGKRFHAVLLTLKETFGNVPGYKDVIVKVAQSYRNLKSEHSEIINEADVKVISLSSIEENAVIIAKVGLGKYLKNHNDSKYLKNLWEKDTFLIDKCNQELIDPIIERLKKYNFRNWNDIDKEDIH